MGDVAGERGDGEARVLGKPLILEATGEQVDHIFRDYLHESFEFRLPPDYPEGALVFRGREGVDQFRAMLSEIWAEWRFEPERFIDADDRVVVFANLVGRGREGGVPFKLETTHVWTMRAGRGLSLQVYRNRSKALEAAGIEE